MYHPETGLARFANASQNALVSTFFAARERWETGEFDNDKVNGEIEWSQEDAIRKLGLLPASANIFVSHKDFVDDVDDYAARTYIWNSLLFELRDLTFKISADGTMSIENFSIRLATSTEENGDNFDWETPNRIAQLGNDLALRPGIDPSDLAGFDATGLALKLEFVGSYQPPGTAYDEADFIADQARYLAENVASNSYLVAEMNSVVQELFDEGTTRTVYADRAILYGTNGDDDLIGFVSPAGYDISASSFSLGVGTVHFPLAEFAQNGVAYVTGDGDDSVMGTLFNDIFLSASGADSYDG